MDNVPKNMTTMNDDKFLREDLNTYLVSHGWSHPLLEKIEVVKEENISRME